jgi:hypothetical protein
MSETKYKDFAGRKVKSERVITRGPNVEFGALYEAQDILEKDGYIFGLKNGNDPIPFCKTPLVEGINFWPAWINLFKEDKDKLDGILVSSDFRNDSVKIIFFDNE